MTQRRQIWTLSAVGFVIVAAMLGALVERLTNHIADRVESRFGYQPDPEGTREFLSELDRPTFAAAAGEAMAEAKGVDTFLYRHVQKAHQSHYGLPWKCWDQGDHGSCVSFAFALGAYTGQSVDFVEGRMARPPPEVATEPIYGGSRTAARLPPITKNNGGDGSYGGAAARWISGKCKDPAVGGILYRERYGDVDLSTYSIPRSIAWGRDGVPLALAREANQHKAVAVAQVRTWDELCASIERGSPVVLCSNVGYGRADRTMPVRDSDGFLQRGTPWGHAMLCWAVRHQKNGSPRDGGLIQNSWSERWCRGPKWPEDQPDGSFWASRENIQAALDQGDCFAIGGVDGFKWRVLDHGNWFQPNPDTVANTYSLAREAAMLIDRKLVAVVFVALAAGWWLGSSPASPINPQPQRPVLNALARLTRTAARLGLWMAFAAEPAPEQRDPRIVQHSYDAEGHRVVDHGEGW